MAARRLVKNILTIVVVGTAAGFFAHSFWKSWIDIRSFSWRIDIGFLLLSFAALAGNSLLATYACAYALNSLSRNRKITFSDSVAVVHANNLLKYVPGKIWPYAAQFYWFSRLGFSRAAVSSVFFINTFASVVTFVIVGAGYLVFSPGLAPRSLSLAALSCALLGTLLFIEFNAPVVNGMIAVFNAVTGSEVSYAPTARRQLRHLHGVYLLAAVSFGLGAYFLARAMGFQVEPDMVLPIMSAMLLADVAGFLSVIAPGGLGVKEGAMYLLLSKGGPAALALLLPVAARLASMLVDAVIGVIGYLLLRRLRGKPAC